MGGSHDSYLSASVYAPGWTVQETIKDSKLRLTAMLHEPNTVWLHLAGGHFEPMLNADLRAATIKPPTKLIRGRMM